MFSVKSLFKLLSARLSRRIVLWVFINIITIEVIILIPSVRKYERELLANLQKDSAIAAKLLLQKNPSQFSTSELSEQLQKLQIDPHIVGGILYQKNGEEIADFGRKPDLSWEIIKQNDLQEVRSKNGGYYDVAYSPNRLGSNHFLIIRHDSSFVKPAVYAYIGRIAGLVVIISVFVTLATMLALGPIAIAPILKLRKDLIRAGEVLAEEREAAEFESLAYYRPDELGETILAFGQMFEQLIEAISERKDAKEELEHLNHELENRVEQRTLALNAEKEKSDRALQELQQTQAQLIHAEKMSSLGQMVAGIAHEINNPTSFIYSNIAPANEYIKELLTVIKLYQKAYPENTPELEEKIEEIDLDFVVEDLPKLLSSMKIGADRIRNIVLGLRIFSRLDEAGFKQVDLHEGIDSTLMILQHKLRANEFRSEIKVVKEYGDLPSITCHASQLNQVFMNILVNGIDALDECCKNARKNGTIETFVPTLKIITKLQEERQIIIRIIDNGTGISEATRSRLFDPFFTTKPIGKGTGLGLSISYQIIVEKHNGQLTCHSTPGEGTELAIALPLSEGIS